MDTKDRRRPEPGLANTSSSITNATLTTSPDPQLERPISRQMISRPRGATRSPNINPVLKRQLNSFARCCR